MFRNSSIAPLLDLRRWLKAVMDVLDGMIRKGVSLSWSLELTVQWECILMIGPALQSVVGSDIGEFRGVVKEGLLCRVSDFIHRVVVHRRDEAVLCWRSSSREEPLVHPYQWSRPGMMPPAPFLQCKPHLTPGVSGVLMRNFEKFGFPSSAVLGKGEQVWRKSVWKQMVGCPSCLRSDRSLLERSLLTSFVARVLLLVVWIVWDGRR